MWLFIGFQVTVGLVTLYIGPETIFATLAGYAKSLRGAPLPFPLEQFSGTDHVLHRDAVRLVVDCQSIAPHSCWIRLIGTQKVVGITLSSVPPIVSFYGM